MKHLSKATDTFLEVALIYLGCILVAAFCFSMIEGETFFRSLYWAGITATSTGYGDITPKTEIGMVLAFILTHLSIFFIAPLIIVRLTEKILHDEHEWSHEEQEQLKVQLDRIERTLNEKK